MTDFIEALERDLVAAAERRAAARGTAAGVRRPRLGAGAGGSSHRGGPGGSGHGSRLGGSGHGGRLGGSGLRSFLLAGALVVTTAGASAAGTLTVLRGSPLPGPAERDAGPAQTPASGTSQVSAVRAQDPDGGPAWTVRVSRSQTGLLCSTAGQLVGDEFGLVGLDGRFRAFAEGIVDGCGEERRDGASLIGARVFDARRREAVRTVVNGVGGPALRRVQVDAGGRSRTVPVVPGGVFALALRGYPEDLVVRVRLAFADGGREEHPLGASPFVVPDGAGGPAWRSEAAGLGGDDRSCVSFRPARPSGRDPAISPSVCGRWPDVRRRTGWFLAIRRVEPTGCERRSTLGGGRWCRAAPRTAAWGAVGEDVRRVELLGAPGGPRELTIAPNRAVVAVLPASVDPARLGLRLTLRGGTTRTVRGESRTVDPPEVR